MGLARVRAAFGAQLAAVVATSALAGCILFVSPHEYGAHCRFANEESACGACMASKCGTAVDACCSDDACDPTLALVEQCAGGDANGCMGVAADQSAAAPSRTALAACFARQCQATCLRSTPTTNITECSASAFGEGQTCSCVVSSTPNRTACDEVAFPNTRCCAPMGWPAPGLACRCQAFDCGPTSDGCSCMLTDGPSGGTQCPGTICCLDHDACTCGSLPCLSPDQKVDTCDFAKIGCARGLQSVPSCTVSAK